MQKENKITRVEKAFHKKPEQSIYYCDPELSTDRCVKN